LVALQGTRGQRPRVPGGRRGAGLLVLASGSLGRQIRVPKAAVGYAWKGGAEHLLRYALWSVRGLLPVGPDPHDHECGSRCRWR